jgi:cell wall-associated NlpC family hydrolase
MWATSYMGLPFVDRGRDRKGVDCWGLVCLAFKEQRGETIPEFEGVSPDDDDMIPALIDIEKQNWRAVAIDQRQEFDVVVMNARIVRHGRAFAPAMHLGIVTPDLKILHTQQPYGVSCVTADHPSLRGRIVGVYRR